MAASSSLRNMIFLIAVLYLATIATLHFVGNADGAASLSAHTISNQPLIHASSGTILPKHAFASPKQQTDQAMQPVGISINEDKLPVQHAGISIIEDKLPVAPVQSPPSPQQPSNPIPPTAALHKVELQHQAKKKGTVAYAVTITRDGP
jgi:hypothetical protein